MGFQTESYFSSIKQTTHFADSTPKHKTPWQRARTLVLVVAKGISRQDTSIRVISVPLQVRARPAFHPSLMQVGFSSGRGWRSGGGARGNRQVVYVGEILALFIYLFTDPSLMQVGFFRKRIEEWGGARGNPQVVYVGEILALFIYLFTGTSLMQVGFFRARG